MLGASMEAKLELWAVLWRNAQAPFAGVAGSVYAVGELEMAPRRVGRRRMPSVDATHRFGSWSRKLSLSETAAAIAGSFDASARQWLPAGGCANGAGSTRAGKLQESPRQGRPKLAEGAA